VRLAALLWEGVGHEEASLDVEGVQVVVMRYPAARAQHDLEHRNRQVTLVHSVRFSSRPSALSTLVLICLLASAIAPTALAVPSTDAARQEYERGKQLLQDGRFDEAEQAFERAQSMFQQEGASGEPSAPEAVSALRQSAPADLEGNQRATRQHLDEARGAMGAGHRLQALIQAQHALELDPANEEAKQLVAEAYRAVGRTPARRTATPTTWSAMPKHTPAAKRAKRATSTRASETKEKVRVVTPSQLRRSSSKPILGEYHISIGDVLEVFLWQHPDLSREAVVRPDGRISVPLVGDLEVVAMTLPELDELLTERFQNFVKMPDVSLAIRRFGGSKVIVLGEVSRPGIFVPSGDGRVLDVIAMAGWFTKQAGQDNVFLIRSGRSTPEVAKLNLNLKKSVKDGDVIDNVSLQSDDIVFVPPGKVASVVQFIERFYPTLNAALVGTSVASSLGFDSTISDFTKKGGLAE
jgi:polysaccharide export outer membrane protein